MGFWDKYGGLVTTAKKQVSKKMPMTVHQMLQGSIDKQKHIAAGDKGSWWKDGKVRPVVGIYSLVDGDKNGVEVEKGDFSTFLNAFEEHFKDGGFDKELMVVEEKQKKALEKRRAKMKSE